MLAFIFFGLIIHGECEMSNAAMVERVAARFDPRTADPGELADALLARRQAATPGISSTAW